jgi:GT2 family glycosyltransferase
VKLSIVILCWNDRDVITACIRSIYANTHKLDFEIIVSDNGSTDGSPDFIRKTFPSVIVIENGTNLRFSAGNNVGIQVSKGEYVLILNPDTLIHEGSLDRWLEYADRHADTGGFGCRVLNPDGSYQGSARPFPTIWREWLAALFLHPLGYLSDIFISDRYVRWRGRSEKLIDWHSGCCLLVRSDLLRRLGGFDTRFYYYYEDVDLCRRIWDAGYTIRFDPDVTITHIGGQSTTRRYPIPFEIDKYRNRYRYFYKYFGESGARRCRRYSLARLRVRLLGYSLLTLLSAPTRTEALKRRLQVYRAGIKWNADIDPLRIVEDESEPTPHPETELVALR